MNYTQKRMLKLLDEVKNTYRTPLTGYNGGNDCYYVPGICRNSQPSKTGKGRKSLGCAIGRKLPAAHKKMLAAQTNAEGYNFINVGRVRKLFNCFEHAGLNIPKLFDGIDYSFLEALQGLHDDKHSWSYKGITKHGMKEYNRIKNFILDGVYNK